MVEVLKGEGPFTVFAPIDEAFGQLPPGVLEWLLAEESGKALEAVVLSHIVPGAALLTEDLLDREVEVETLGGGALGIGGTAGIILVVPLEATITEVKGRASRRAKRFLHLQPWSRRRRMWSPMRNPPRCLPSKS